MHVHAHAHTQVGQRKRILLSEWAIRERQQDIRLGF